MKGQRSKVPLGTRKHLLKRLGFKNYKEYLKSDLWISIRNSVLQRDQYICKICGGRAVQVHHRTYCWRSLIGERNEMLVSLCGGCHYEIEYKPDGRKRDIAHANSTLKHMIG